MALSVCHEVACQQVLTAEGTVFSIQWTIFPPEVAPGLTATALLERYLTHIRRFTLSIVRPHVAPEGVFFQLAGTKWSLLTFLPVEAEGDRVRLRISGGFLVQREECRSGEISFSVEPVPTGSRAAVTLRDFCPLLLGSRRPSLLRKWLYRLTQAYIHRLVTVGFLARLSRELLGRGRCVRVVDVHVRDGERI